ncbi:gephyrin-like molybdotransferase Glp [Haloarcula salinisoli]|uniref:Molybdopterin molybdotransferase MoeA n=1 Tax=Haloarcula salinisoli TaxID=2487746 RepID=A0A8J7YGR5_9EURY|nr:gephyrin-like molybdotransferase Glp [Halomicroarcula salinisoli]MBX0287244.1 molybdopterin molybdotransferase MoeA [Halomicroarcula salinisoli]MBX0305192.1 molybdopterin molybdotransferase MoeA [Halomicroarcula salinisoli]
MNDNRAGFEEFTRTAAARERLLEAVTPTERTERVELREADDRVVATAVTADRPVPHYERAAMDGYAVRARDTFGASERSPASLRIGDTVRSGTAARVHTGSELPDGADAVVMVEATERTGDELAVFEAVPEGGNVGPVGEDVAEGQDLFEPGHRLRPSDLGLLKAVGLETIEVYERPHVSVVPTGEELVQADPDPGEIIETNGQTVTQYVERWGGEATYRDVVTDDADELRAAIERDLDHDIVVTTGGSSVGERDIVPTVVAELGEVFVHGVALKPGHPVALGAVEGTPVLMLPGYPVACIVNAVQFLRPSVAAAGHRQQPGLPTTEAHLERKIPSEPGVRTFARVTLDVDDEGSATATPTRTKGAGVLSSVALADGWVVVPEEREGYAEGATVAVEEWEGCA